MELLIEFYKKLSELNDFQIKLLQAGHHRLAEDLKTFMPKLNESALATIGEQYVTDLEHGAESE